METKTSGEGRFDRLSDEPPDATHQQKPRFLQFSCAEFLLLVAVFGVLPSVIAPRIHRTFQEWRGQEATRKREAAGTELSTAVRTNNIALARHGPLEAGADPNLILTGSSKISCPRLALVSRTAKSRSWSCSWILGWMSSESNDYCRGRLSLRLSAICRHRAEPTARGPHQHDTAPRGAVRTLEGRSPVAMRWM